MPSDSVKESGRRIDATLIIARVDGLTGNLYCKATLTRSQRSFVTPPAKDGVWNETFCFTCDGSEEINLQIFERGWFGMHHMVANTSIILEYIGECHSKHKLVLEDSVATLLVEVMQRVVPACAPAEKYSYHSQDSHALMGYIQKKLDFYATVDITEQTMNDGADEDITVVLGELKTSLKEYGYKSNNATYSDMLDNLVCSARTPQITQEINFWNSLYKLAQPQVSPPPSAQQGQHNQALIEPSYEEASPRTVNHNQADIAVMYAERLKALRDELEVQRNMVQLLRNRNAELESEMKQKAEELARIKENDVIRDKVVWERLELFDEKCRQLEITREQLHEFELSLMDRKRELDDRERELKQSVSDMQVKNDSSRIKSHALLQASPNEDSMWSSNAAIEQLASISQKLAKLDHLDEVISRLHTSIATGGPRSPVKQSKRSAADIKAEMEKLQQIILDDSAQAKDREAANLKIDRLFVELASTDEYKQEIKRAQEEKARVNEPLNKEALQVMLQRFREHGNEEDIQIRKKQYAALTLIGMESDTILGKHQNDFNQFLLGDLTLVELRAIRASLPMFRRDQKKQLEFVEAVDLKIEQLMKNPIRIPAVPKKVFPAIPLGGSAGNLAKKPAANVSMGNIAAEIMAKRKKAEEN